jgi:SAM-dependent methyltransferase
VTQDTNPNEAQAAEWNGPSGAHRAKYDALINNEIRRHNERFRAVAEVGPRDHVLDIGCGTGESTRDAARAAVDGSVVGVDLSEEMLTRARGMSMAEGLDNVTFLQADAQVHDFGEADFDLAVSRFGTMFFADPAAAFTNIGRALRPGARLVIMVWQSRERNEWSTAVRDALGGTAPVKPGPGAFALADPTLVVDVLEAAGFTEITAIDVHEPVCYGPDVATAYDFTIGLRSTRDVLAGLDAGATESALQRLRLMLAMHETEDGILFDSRSWIVTAVRQEQDDDYDEDDDQESACDPD